MTKSFFEQVQDVVVPAGVASDRLVRDMEKWGLAVYLSGLRAGIELGKNDIGDDYLDDVLKKVEKTKQPLPEK